MNQLKPLVLFLGIIAFTGCSSQKDFVTESDYSYTGKFKDYKTFDFASLIENDSLILKDLIESTITSKLQAQGYRHQSKKPDLLIVYRIYIDDFNMSGYDQPNLQAWVTNDWGEKFESGQDWDAVGLPENMRAEYDNRKYLMQSGTLLVSFYDRKGNKSVWQGYASGVFENNNESAYRSLKLAAHKIVREFKLVANGYVGRRSDS